MSEGKTSEFEACIEETEEKTELWNINIYIKSHLISTINQDIL